VLERLRRVLIGVRPRIVDFIRRYLVIRAIDAWVLDGELKAGRRILLREEANDQLEIDLVRLLVEAFHWADIIFIQEGERLGV